MSEEKRVTRRDLGRVAALGAASVTLGTHLRAEGGEVAAKDAAGKASGPAGPKMDFITYCGLYCGLCAERCRIPKQAAALTDSLHKEGWDSFALSQPGAKEFWRILNDKADPAKACRGCRSGGGFPGCQIRKCAREKSLTACPDCADYPCAKISDFAKVYPTTISDGGRMKEVGIERWAAEQEERAKAGFCYADIRITRQEG